MRIIITGLIGQYAFGGVAWDYLQYVEGFRQLGHEVWYLEDTETWPYDPIQNTVSAECAYNVGYLRNVMDKLGLDGRWIYRNCPDASYHGLTETAAKQICANADLFVNVSGCCWMRPEYASIRKKIFIDSDPMFTQVGLLNAKPDVLDRVKAHNVHFTFAEHIRADGCRIPSAGLNWIPTRQPIVLDWWPTSPTPPRDVWTTVMNWVSYKPCEYNGDTWGQKDVEMERFMTLPSRTQQRMELACGRGPGNKRPTQRLLDHGWRIIEPDEHLPDPWKYRDYLRSSKGEWSIAKEAYVKSRSGWFSCRSACYLALGRPCVLQDTGWSGHYPSGEGLLAFATIEEAVAGLEKVASDYEQHAHAARQLAERFFDARRVLSAMLEEAGL